MIVKTVEIRDSGTFIPAIAIKMVDENHAQRFLLRRAGFSLDHPSIMLVTMATEKAAYDPFNWRDRTHQVAHQWLAEHFDEIGDGFVVDVEFILGETAAPKTSERSL